MPKSGKTNSRKKKKSNSSINPSENVIVYRGPLQLPQGLQERQKITTVTHKGPTTFSASGAGAISITISDDPSTSVDWSLLAGAWDEYRILGFTFHYMPFNRYTSSSANQIGPIFTVIDRDDSTGLTTESQALEYESLKVYYLGDPFKRQVRSMTSIEDASFITTATPVARNWLKGICVNITPSLGVGEFWIDYLIQFRGRN
jgi:hypothetical protein